MVLKPLSRRAWWVGLAYMALLIPFALWNEVRLLLPLFVLWGPMMASAVDGIEHEIPF
jgi:hypothetical protein